MSAQAANGQRKRKTNRKTGKSLPQQDAAQALLRHKLKKLSDEPEPSAHLTADQAQAQMMRNMMINKMKLMLDDEIHQLTQAEQIWTQGSQNEMHKE